MRHSFDYWLALSVLREVWGSPKLGGRKISVTELPPDRIEIQSWKCVEECCRFVPECNVQDERMSPAFSLRACLFRLGDDCSVKVNTTYDLKVPDNICVGSKTIAFDLSFLEIGSARFLTDLVLHHVGTIMNFGSGGTYTGLVRNVPCYSKEDELCEWIKAPEVQSDAYYSADSETSGEQQTPEVWDPQNPTGSIRPRAANLGHMMSLPVGVFEDKSYDNLLVCPPPDKDQKCPLLTKKNPVQSSYYSADGAIETARLIYSEKYWADIRGDGRRQKDTLSAMRWANKNRQLFTYVNGHIADNFSDPLAYPSNLTSVDWAMTSMENSFAPRISKFRNSSTNILYYPTHLFRGSSFNVNCIGLKTVGNPLPLFVRNWAHNFGTLADVATDPMNPIHIILPTQYVPIDTSNPVLILKVNTRDEQQAQLVSWDVPIAFSRVSIESEKHGLQMVV